MRVYNYIVHTTAIIVLVHTHTKKTIQKIRNFNVVVSRNGFRNQINTQLSR